MRKGRFLARILRHEPEIIGLDLDPNGWANIDEFLKKCKSVGVPFKYTGAPYTRDEVLEIIASDDKGRFVLGNNGKMMRAVHGHSVDIEIDASKECPPDVLYHGTTGRYLDAIFREGIKSMKRRLVHLSETVEQARQVGGRHGAPVILQVDAGSLHSEGQDFFRSSSKVWLTDHVKPGYFHISEGAD